MSKLITFHPLVQIAHYVESYEPYLFYECGLHDRVYIIGCVEDQSRFFRGTGRLETDGRAQGE